MHTSREKSPGNHSRSKERELKLNRKDCLKPRRKYWVIKRIQDIILSLIALAVLWPVMLVIAVIIWLDDPHGSPIFSQIRCGRDCKEFRFYKFRSMYVNAEDKLEELLKHNEMDGPAFKIKDDPRITRVGRFLRKTSLDELPQLWNILKGDMTIVGPRPALPREVAQYDDYQKQRMYVTPGLTCYWQIQPNRNDVSFEEWIEMDIQYIKDRSILLDWRIIFLTVGAVLKMDGE